MRTILSLLFFAAAAGSPFAGRWDLTVTPANGQGSWPQWMELVDSGGGPTVRVQPRAGSVFPVKGVTAAGSHLTLGVQDNVTWELDVLSGRISGSQKGNAPAQIAGVRAPAL
ncbi:MAG TPA: DUF1080 domain-containing protein, partial [Candidatus Sulfopaludibacter sp.]|nr:DUF1080 domain-containing protein [Candidatus Sulfopaludibacter sp.]